MQGKGGFHQEIEKLQEAKTYGASRIDQIREERLQAENVDSRRRRADSEDDDDFIDNTGEDMVKTMRRVKVAEPDEEEDRVIDGAITKSFKNVKVFSVKQAYRSKTTEKHL